MQFKGRSLYNLLKITLKEDENAKVEPWQVLDYRSMQESELFLGLEKLGISLTKETFFLYSENCDHPEELLETLWVEESEEEKEDQAYLLLFELWRRLLPEKQSLSIFCDELDHLIFLYDDGRLEDEERLQTALGELEDILDQSVDHGADPKEIFQSVTGYMAHDLEQFLYDYVLDLIESSNELYASELVDGMSAYVSDPKWFDLLKARLFALSHSPEVSVLISRILEQAEEEPDVEFYIELAYFLVSFEDSSYFLQTLRLLIPLIQNEEDTMETLRLMSMFCQLMDKEALSDKIEAYLSLSEEGVDQQLAASLIREFFATFL